MVEALEKRLRRVTPLNALRGFGDRTTLESRMHHMMIPFFFLALIFVLAVKSGQN